MKVAVRVLMILWALCCSLPVGAIPVGAVTDSAGVRVGIWDMSERRDTPWKLHQRYCLEKATLRSVAASVLQPNGIVNDRQMPAWEKLRVQCQDMRPAWKEMVFPDEQSQVVRGNQQRTEALQKRVQELGVQVGQLTTQVASLMGEAQRQRTIPVAAQEPLGENYRLWSMVLLVAILVGFGLLARYVFRVRQKQQRAVQGRASVAYLREVSPRDIAVTVVLPDPRGTGLRVFRYQAAKAEAGYPVLRSSGPGQEALRLLAGERLTQEVQGSLERYLYQRSDPRYLEERGFIDKALAENRLVELTPL